MDDNARPHRARVVNDYLEDEGIERLDWPSRSPDLNPIDHAWDALHRRINARLAQTQTAQQLANALVVEWVRIPRKVIKTLVLSFWTRCTEVIDARGGHTRYLHWPKWVKLLPRYKFQKYITPSNSMKRVCVSDMAVYSLLIVNCFLKHLY